MPHSGRDRERNLISMEINERWDGTIVNVVGDGVRVCSSIFSLKHIITPVEYICRLLIMFHEHACTILIAQQILAAFTRPESA